MERRRWDCGTPPNVLRLADRGQMRHNRRPSRDTIRLTTEDVSPWVHGCLHLLPHAVRRAVMVLLHTTSPDQCVHCRGQHERSSHADTAPSGRATSHHRRDPSTAVSITATSHCPVAAPRVYR